MLAVVDAKFREMADVVTDEELNPIKEFMLKEAQEGREKNDDWSNAIVGSLINGVDTFNGIDEVIKAVTTDDIRAFMKSLLDQNNYRVVVIDPENAEK